MKWTTLMTCSSLTYSLTAKTILTSLSKKQSKKSSTGSSYTLLKWSSDYFYISPSVSLFHKYSIFTSMVNMRNRKCQKVLSYYNSAFTLYVAQHNSSFWHWSTQRLVTQVRAIISKMATTTWTVRKRCFTRRKYIWSVIRMNRLSIVPRSSGSRWSPLFALSKALSNSCNSSDTMSHSASL